MFQIKENWSEESVITIMAYGILNDESIFTLKHAFKKHLTSNKKVFLNLEGLTHISREGRDFLEQIQGEITLLNPPQFMKLETDD